MKSKKLIDTNILGQIQDLDNRLSQRFISLDPKGYFLIKVDKMSQEIILERYGNNIDELGRAVDIETGKPLECNEKNQREPISIYKGRSAKEIGMKITEGDGPLPISKIDHALYLGRELQKAEHCLIHGTSYVQD